MVASAAPILDTPESGEIPEPVSHRRVHPGFEGLAPEVVRALVEQEILSDEPEMDSDDHRELMLLLIECLKRWWHDRSDVYVSGNLSIFYMLSQFDLARPLDKQGQLRRSKHRFRGPDVFVVFGAEPTPRPSWVVWREGGKYPNVIFEIVSRKTKKADRGIKKEIYQDIFRTPEYFLFDPKTARLEGHALTQGGYSLLTPDAAGRLHSAQMNLDLGVVDRRLRLFTPKGDLLLSAAEAEQQARQGEQQARQGEQQARQGEQEARQKAELFAAKLRAMGVDPDALR